jgi:hypothetical protein
MADYAIVHGDTLMVYSGGQIVARIEINRFPGLIVELATALRWRERPSNDPNVPLG